MQTIDTYCYKAHFKIILEFECTKVHDICK
jgi:hypothetical protein